MSDTLTFIDNNKSRFEEELFNWLRIPSISTDSQRKDDIRKAAEYLSEQLKKVGIDEVKKEIEETNDVLRAGDDDLNQD